MVESKNDEKQIEQYGRQSWQPVSLVDNPGRVSFFEECRSSILSQEPSESHAEDGWQIVRRPRQDDSNPFEPAREVDDLQRLNEIVQKCFEMHKPMLASQVAQS